MLAARGVWVVLYTYATLGVPHHPPLTLTPLGLATQDFRLAPGTLFSPAECNLRGNRGKGFSCRAALQLFKEKIIARHCDHTFWKKVGEKILAPID